MPAPPPTAIVTEILDIAVNPVDSSKVDFDIVFRMLFVPDATAPAKLQQKKLTVEGNFSKNDVRVAAHALIIAAVAEEGAVITSNRIFGVDDLV